MSFFEAIVRYCGHPDCDHHCFCRCDIGKEVSINNGMCESFTNEQSRYLIFKNVLREHFGPVSESVVNDVCNFIQGKLKSEGQEKEEK